MTDWFCPQCGHIDKNHAFIIVAGNVEVGSMVKCPHCLKYVKFAELKPYGAH